MLSWIMSGIGIILLVETWEHEEYKIPKKDLSCGRYGTRDPTSIRL
jgi:hypothetical protein